MRVWQVADRASNGEPIGYRDPLKRLDVRRFPGILLKAFLTARIEGARGERVGFRAEVLGPQGELLDFNEGDFTLDPSPGEISLEFGPLPVNGPGALVFRLVPE